MDCAPRTWTATAGVGPSLRGSVGCWMWTYPILGGQWPILATVGLSWPSLVLGDLPILLFRSETLYRLRLQVAKIRQRPKETTKSSPWRPNLAKSSKNGKRKWHKAARNCYAAKKQPGGGGAWEWPNSPHLQKPSSPCIVPDHPRRLLMHPLILPLTVWLFFGEVGRTWEVFPFEEAKKPPP